MSTQSDILLVQQALNKSSNAGLTEDGVTGPATVEAIKQYQLAHNLLPDGRVSPELISALNTVVGTTSNGDGPLSLFDRSKTFVVENKTPIIILGSIGIFGWGIWFVKHLRK